MKHSKKHQNIAVAGPQLQPLGLEVTGVRQFVMVLVIAAILAVSCVACNTAHGFGKDVEKAGEKIQDGTK